jgi:membrane protease YdiL (CAAX protease family)
MIKPSKLPKSLNTLNYSVQPPVGTILSVPKWIMSFIFIELMWTFLGGLATYLFSTLLATIDPGLGILSRYVVQHVNFIILLGVLLGFIHLGLRIGALRFITDEPQFRWRNFLLGFGVWSIGLTAFSIIMSILQPGSIRFNSVGFQSRSILFLLVIILTPLQCIAEELLFRTLLWRIFQGTAAKNFIRNIVSGALFTLAHLTNSEVSISFQGFLVLAFYFSTGFLFMEITSQTRGTEATIGAHIGNNLFLAIFVNYTGSSLESHSLFVQEKFSIQSDLLIVFCFSMLLLRFLEKGQKHEVPSTGN